MCTAISLISKQNEVFFGRTMDFNYDLDLEAYIIPRNYKYNGEYLKNNYQTKYAFICTGQPTERLLAADGMNEKGLGVAALYFPRYAYFKKRKTPNKLSIASTEVVNYLLSNCQNIEEIISLAPILEIIGVPDSVTNQITPLHWIATDKTGKSITIESTKYGLNILQNPVGVLTNSPDFNWHCTNLSNYMMATPESPNLKEWGDLTLKALSKGIGSYGIPGDFTSTSRFVRITFAKKFLKIPKTREEMVQSCFNIMNLVTIPKGIVIANNNSPEYTQYTNFMNLNTGDYYFISYYNNEIKYANIKDNNSDKVLFLGKIKSYSAPKHI